MWELQPFIVEKIWGGERIARLKNWPARRIGETLEVSRLPEAPAQTNQGKLFELLSEEELSYVVKFIDTSDNLSVQVHPNDEYAQKLENQRGKTECWYILEAGPGAGVYLGFRPGMTKEKFQKIVIENGNANECLNFVPVKKGDFFYVPAGAIHAIGRDVFLLEVQQSSGITYRVWDWNRVESSGKPRELHVEKAMQVTDFSEGFQQNLLGHLYSPKLVKHTDFNFSILDISSSFSKIDFTPTKRFISLIAFDEQVEINYAEKKISLAPYHSLLLKPDAKQNLLLSCKTSTKVALVY
jgi:mannose-6-phosphate isomerase